MAWRVESVDAAENHIYLILLDESGSCCCGNAVRGSAVFNEKLDLTTQQAASGVDVVDNHSGDVCIGDAGERKGTRLVCDDADLDGPAG